jgi:tartrate/fumarate subfamily iron-sulfur-dependent hydro-lyase alpha chain
MAITEAIISDVSEHLYEKALKRMPGDIIASLRESCNQETSPVARWNLRVILQNIKAAEEKDLLVCQDTCIPSYIVKMGTRVHVQGDLYRAIALGAQRATQQIPLIPHAVHPLTRGNPGTNVGERVPLLHFDIVPDADFLEIMAVPMAGGGEIYSKLKMFDYTASVAAIHQFVIDTVIATGGNDCAPLIVGVGIGGSFDTVGKLARDAAIRNVSERNGDPAVEKIERELLAAINEIGIGPMGLGGDTTALAVNVEIGFSHRVITPVAVKIHCWAVRRARARIDGDGKVTHL